MDFTKLSVTGAVSVAAFCCAVVIHASAGVEEDGQSSYQRNGLKEKEAQQETEDIQDNDYWKTVISAAGSAIFVTDFLERHSAPVSYTLTEGQFKALRDGAELDIPLNQWKSKSMTGLYDFTEEKRLKFKGVASVQPKVGNFSLGIDQEYSIIGSREGDSVLLKIDGEIDRQRLLEALSRETSPRVAGAESKVPDNATFLLRGSSNDFWHLAKKKLISFLGIIGLVQVGIQIYELPWGKSEDKSKKGKELFNVNDKKEE